MLQRLVNKGVISEKQVEIIENSEVIDNIDFKNVEKKEISKSKEEKKKYYL